MSSGTTAGDRPPRTRPVLVTGSHRSGTTWVGRLLASAEELHYVQEPFNIVDRQRWLHPRPPHQFFYISEANEGDWIEAMSDVMQLRYPLGAHLARRPPVAEMRRVTGVAWRARQSRRAGRAALLKDPIAVFSTEWLMERFDVVPIVLVRDAVSFVGSLKDRGWSFDFRHWLDQPLLMRDHLGAWHDEIRRMAENPAPIVEQGILMWNVIYSFVADLQVRHPSVVVRAYEPIAANPLAEIEGLFDLLGLRFGDAQRAVVTELSTGASGSGTSAIDVRRDSNQALATWRTRLTVEEISLVRTQTADVASRFVGGV